MICLSKLSGVKGELGMNKFKRMYRKIVHGLIVSYLIRCGGAFHHGAYGENGKYVRLFTDKEFNKFQSSK